MLSSLVQWLDSVGSVVFWTCLIGLVAIDGVAAMALFSGRSREIVNRWTTRVLAANLILIGSGTMIPAVTYVIRTAVVALAPGATDRVSGFIQVGVPD